MRKKLEEKAEGLARTLDYSFSEPTLLQAAITHRSIGKLNNERLEFLGDSIVNFVIAAELYKRFPKAREGDLTRMRALLVKGETMASVARELGVGEYLHLGIGEKRSGGYQRDSILADAMEAILGAIYLDSNMETCEKHVLSWYAKRLDHLAPGGLTQKDAKTRLQEYMQAKHLSLPDYQVIKIKGSPHNPEFEVHCRVPLFDEPAFGIGTTRRQAEQNAADVILKALNNGKY